MEGLPLNAAAFIVTVYGDVVVPRGEVLWMGSLIEICSRVGISENLVRTATSRLVSAGRLEGERNGRRSFYRLAPSARAEFAEAAQLLYTRQAQVSSWFVLYGPGISPEDARRHRMGRMGNELWLCPELGENAPQAALALKVELPSEPTPLAVMAGFWDLANLEARYTAMLARFGPLAAELANGLTITPEDALISRLLLVHVYRNALLRDPCLPSASLPADWHGAEARALFCELYKSLSSGADSQVERMLEGSDGPLPARTPETRARLSALT